MPLAPIALNADDFAALFKDPKYMLGAMEAVERAFVDDHNRKVRAGSFADETQVDGKPSSLRFNLVGGQGKLDSVLALGNGGGVSSRFVMLFDGVTRELVALLDSGLLNPLRVGAEAGVAVKHLATPGAKVAAVHRLRQAGRDAGRGAGQRAAVAGSDEGLQPDAGQPRALLPRDVGLAGPSLRARRLRGRGDRRRRHRRPDQPQPRAAVRDARSSSPALWCWRCRAAARYRSTSSPTPTCASSRRRGRSSASAPCASRSSPPCARAATRARTTPADLGDVIVNGTQVRRDPGDIVDFEGTAMPVLEHAATEWAYDWAKAGRSRYNRSVCRRRLRAICLKRCFADPRVGGRSAGQTTSRSTAPTPCSRCPGPSVRPARRRLLPDGVAAARLWQQRGGREQTHRGRRRRCRRGDAQQPLPQARAGARPRRRRCRASIRNHDIYETRDGRWIYLHREFIHHRERIATLLKCADDFGVRPGAVVQNVFTLLKLLALAALVGVGLLAGLPPATPSPAAAPSAIGAALVPVLFTYGGWQQTNFIAEEMVNPERDLPRALLLGVAIVVATYLLANLAYLQVLGPSGLAASTAPAADAMRQVLGPSGATIISAGIAISTFGFLNLVVLVTPRVFQAMAADGVFFPRLARLHPVHRTPSAAIVLQGVWASAWLSGLQPAGGLRRLCRRRSSADGGGVVRVSGTRPRRRTGGSPGSLPGPRLSGDARRIRGGGDLRGG